jgi:hypothetical protein
MFQVEVGGQTFVVDRVTPAQVSAILRIVSRANLKARKTLASLEEVSDSDYIWAFLGSLSEEDLIDLAAASIGCDKKFAEEHFDLRWVVTAVGGLLKHVDIAGVVTNFTSALVPTED